MRKSKYINVTNLTCQNTSWKQLVGELHGTYGPVYTSQIIISKGNVQLDLYLAACTEMGMSNQYERRLWAAVVLEGETTRANYRDDGSAPAPIKRLFDRVEEEFKRHESLKGNPSPERTQSAIKLYLAQ